MMVDPVVMMDGMTYERSAIQQWLDKGNSTSPLTGEKLPSTVLIPNNLVRGQILTFREQHPHAIE